MRLFELELALCSERDDPRFSSLPLQELDLLLREWSGKESQHTQHTCHLAESHLPLPAPHDTHGYNTATIWRSGRSQQANKAHREGIMASEKQCAAEEGTPLCPSWTMYPHDMTGHHAPNALQPLT
jgi:hypothetical protein